MSFTRATSRLEERLRANGDLKLIPYVMAGYPDAAASIELGRAYARAGAAAVEVAIPFSDPLADGPAVQRAGEVALRNGMTVAGALEVAGRVA
jgi:tryptophan synthase alpha chain